MNSSILWNGFEIKKGFIESEVGNVPYLLYTPEISKQSVNIAIHGETMSKNEWLSFASVSKFGNLLKESIKNNSPFLAFDLYGHGDWIFSNRGFYSGNMTKEQEAEILEKSSKGISTSIKKILSKENLIDNPLTITAYSKGCHIALNLNIDLAITKVILISPFNCESTTRCNNIMIFRGKMDQFVKENDFKLLLKSINKPVEVENYDTKHEIPESWINKAKEFIYSN